MMPPRPKTNDLFNYQIRASDIVLQKARNRRHSLQKERASRRLSTVGSEVKLERARSSMKKQNIEMGTKLKNLMRNNSRNKNQKVVKSIPIS